MEQEILEIYYTSGNEFILSDGSNYNGNYFLLTTGKFIIKTGDVIQEIFKVTDLPENNVSQAISQFKDESTDFVGVYEIVPIKNYKNDIDIIIENEEFIGEPPRIIRQPNEFFKRITDDNFNKGEEILINQSNTVTVIKGIIVPLTFIYESDDFVDNVNFEWRDSFDRIVASSSIYNVDTNEMHGDDETFSCTITDTFGSIITNDVTINIIDTGDNPFIFTNIIQNGSADKGSSGWETIGQNNEEVGVFLQKYEFSNNILSTNVKYGTYFYHKFIQGWDGVPNKNQWYPRPEEFDEMNNFNGKVINEIKNNYFRGGIINPVVRQKDKDTLNENDTAGLSKFSIQDIDISEISDMVEGKTRGIQKFKAVLFGWIGGRADQNDEVIIEFEFLDENDDEIIIQRFEGIDFGTPAIGNNKIMGLSAGQRYINYDLYWSQQFKENKLYTGYLNPNTQFDYTGIIYDGNAGILFDRFEKTLDNEP